MKNTKTIYVEDHKIAWNLECEIFYNSFNNNEKDYKAI